MKARPQRKSRSKPVDPSDGASVLNYFMHSPAECYTPRVLVHTITMEKFIREMFVRAGASPHLAAFIMAAAAVALFAALGLILLARRRHKTPEEIERIRRLDINRRGRVTYGQIVDMLEPHPGKQGARLVVFKYEVAGVKYDAAQDIHALPGVVVQVRQATGQMVRIKYIVDRPGNSIMACEEWSGLIEFSPPQISRAELTETADEVMKKS